MVNYLQGAYWSDLFKINCGMVLIAALIIGALVYIVRDLIYRADHPDKSSKPWFAVKSRYISPEEQAAINEEMEFIEEETAYIDGLEEDRRRRHGKH